MINIHDPLWWSIVLLLTTLIIIAFLIFFYSPNTIKIKKLIKSVTSGDYENNNDDFTIDHVEIKINVSTKYLKNFYKG